MGLVRSLASSLMRRSRLADICCQLDLFAQLRRNLEG